MSGAATLPFAPGDLPTLKLPLLPESHDPYAYDPNVYDPKKRAYRVAYAARAYRTGLYSSTRTFDTCFEMNDGEEVAQALLGIALTDTRLREAMHSSRCCNLAAWIEHCPDFRPHFDAIDVKYALGTNRD